MKLHVLWFSFVVSWHAGFAAPSVGAGQAALPGRTKIDVSKLGPQIGERVPDFSLKDQTGKTQTLNRSWGRRARCV
jgi:hypothetical protein